MTGITFAVEESPEGGYTARALGHSIFTEADALPELWVAVIDAVGCHLGEEARPGVIRLCFVDGEVIRA
jgi:hypothetical protein